MASTAGWYPDPGGEAGRFRWWDGQAWTTSLTDNPYGPPPAAGQFPVQGSQPTSPYGSAQGPTGGESYATGPTAYTSQPPRRGRTIATLAVAGLVLIGLVFGGVWVINRITGGLGGQGDIPSNPTSDVCPKQTFDNESAEPLPQAPAGRVQGGQLSYPELGSPWGPPMLETRVPFGRGVFGQDVMLHENYDGAGASWVASIDVGELVAGDGFFSPQQGSEIVTRCLVGVFYGGAEISRTDVVNEATTIDGYDAWVTEMHLGFSIPDLDETGETAIVIIVATSMESSSIFFASIPDSRPDLLETARGLQKQLKVEE
ncbi:MAG: DUF2510 domain-containing protein [Propioniciclava sp.]